VRVETHDRILEDLSKVQDHLRVADSAMKLRRHKEENSDAWEALSAEVLKEASIARAGLSRVLDRIAEDMAHDTNKPGRALDEETAPEWVNRGRPRHGR
jgi:hypothetical protein